MSHRLSPLAVLLILSCGAAACGDKRQVSSKPAAGSVPGKAAQAQPKCGTAQPGPQSPAALMQEMALHARDLRRRLGSFPLTDRADLLVAAVQRIPVARRPPDYVAARDQLLQRAQALRTTKKPREDYTALIEACSGCHQRHAKGSLPEIEKLRPAARPGSGSSQ
jgi:hypothetical protein